MRKRLLFGVGIVLVLILLLLCRYFLPEIIYYNVLKNGINSRYLYTNAGSKAMISANAKTLEKQDKENFRWKQFHFDNFIITLPVKHPEYSIIPHISGIIKKGTVSIGVKFLSYKNNKSEDISLIVDEIGEFDFLIGDQILFDIPIVRNKLKNYSPDGIIRDLFGKDLFAVKRDDYLGMVYNLYLMKLRQNYFTGKIKNLTYLENLRIGIVQMEESDPEYTKEKIYVFDETSFYSLILKVNKTEKISSEFRKKLLVNLAFKKSSIDSSRIIYVDYKTLDLKQRIDQEGMTYLFMAFSHVINDKDFLRYMIQFLEKGRNNLVRLIPLYNFSYDNYQTNFSRIESIRKEKQDVYMKRKLQEEFDEDKNRIIKLDSSGEVIDFKGSDAEMMDYYLQKAKKAGVNLDDNKKFIIVD